MSGAEDAGKEVVANSLYRYVENNINDYLTENIYCSGSSFKCEKLSYTGNKLSLELSPSYSTYNIVWVACSDEVSSEFSFSTETKAQALVDDYTVVGKTAKSTSPVKISSISCPRNPVSLVVAYQTTTSNKINIYAIDLQTKEELVNQILDSLHNSTTNTYSSMLGSSSYSNTNPNEYVLDFEDAEIMRSSFANLDNVAGTSGAILGMKISIKYHAIFPGKITSAMVDDEEVDFDGNEIDLSLSDLEDLPAAPLVVVAEKDISPLGVFTWVILGAIIIGIVAFVFLSKKKQSFLFLY